MLTATQIFDLIKGDEGYNVDFNRSVPSKVKELSSLSLIEYRGAKKTGGYFYK